LRFSFGALHLLRRLRELLLHGLSLLPWLIRLRELLLLRGLLLYGLSLLPWLSRRRRRLLRRRPLPDRRLPLRLGPRTGRVALLLKMLLRDSLTRLVAVILRSNRMLLFYRARIAVPGILLLVDR